MTRTLKRWTFLDRSKAYSSWLVAAKEIGVEASPVPTFPVTIVHDGLVLEITTEGQRGAVRVTRR